MPRRVSGRCKEFRTVLLSSSDLLSADPPCSSAFSKNGFLLLLCAAWTYLLTCDSCRRTPGSSSPPLVPWKILLPLLRILSPPYSRLPLDNSCWILHIQLRHDLFSASLVWFPISDCAKSFSREMGRWRKCYCSGSLSIFPHSQHRDAVQTDRQTDRQTHTHFCTLPPNENGVIALL